jgi:hypothetical protein
MDEILKLLLDEREIIAAVNELFIRTDRKDWPAVEACFADEVEFDMTSLAGGAPARLGPAQIVDGWRTGLAPIEAVHHLAGNHLVRVTGDEATAFCYGIAHHFRRTKSGRNTRVFAGSYDLGLRRSPTGWKIHQFRFTAKFVDGNLELERDA